nr:CBL-interacting serine/threonine-protein kinase 6 [Ipomoea batatas]GMC65037.1 CBL-interacting serine/threonine-protein kinase 6 [Ipomoea batatas]GME12344.1 CBL-interacting serine/threonine-protein kinase 6 [Ipomoea batatas]
MKDFPVSNPLVDAGRPHKLSHIGGRNCHRKHVEDGRGKMQCFVREIRAGEVSRAWNLREGVPRAERAHGEELGDEGRGEGESGEGGDDGADKARNLGHEYGEAPQHRGALRGDGQQDEDLLRHGARPRRRAVREDLQGAVTRGIGEELLPPLDFRGRFLSQPRGLPPGLEARESVIRRRWELEGNGFRAQRVFRSPPPRRPAAHHVRHAGLRGAGGDREEGLRWGEG